MLQDTCTYSTTHGCSTCHHHAEGPRAQMTGQLSLERVTTDIVLRLGIDYMHDPNLE